MIWSQYTKIQFVEKCHNFMFLTVFSQVVVFWQEFEFFML